MSYTQKVTTEILCFVLSKRQTGCSNSSRCTFIRRKEPFLTFFTSSCKYKAETKHHQVMTTTPTWGNNYMGCRATNLEHRPFVCLAAKKYCTFACKMLTKTEWEHLPADWKYHFYRITFHIRTQLSVCYWGCHVCLSILILLISPGIRQYVC